MVCPTSYFLYLNRLGYCPRHLESCICKPTLPSPLSMSICQRFIFTVSLPPSCSNDSPFARFMLQLSNQYYLADRKSVV